MTSSNETTLPPELAQIAAEAQAIAPPPVDAETGTPSVPVDYLTDARGLTDIIAEGLGAIYPSTAQVLNEDRRARFAAALSPVMEKYGLSLGVVFGRWGTEINLAFVTVSFALPLANAISADRAAAREAKQVAEIIGKPADPQPERPAGDPYAAAFQPA